MGGGISVLAVDLPLQQGGWANVICFGHAGIFQGSKSPPYIHQIIPSPLLQDGGGNHASISTGTMKDKRFVFGKFR